MRASVPPHAQGRRSSASSDPRLSASSVASRGERQPLLAAAPPPQVFVHPVECASLTSRLLLRWVGPALALAHRPTHAHTLSSLHAPAPTPARGLQQADVWELPPRARAEAGANALQGAWIASGSLTLALLRAQGPKMAALGALHAAVLLCDLLGPYVLFRAVSLLQDQDADHADAGTEDVANAHHLIFWLGALLTSRVLRALLSAFVNAELQTTALRLAAALQSLVFQKALRLHASADTAAVDHEAQDLYTADVPQLLRGVSCLQDLWAAVATLGLALGLLASMVGAAACASCAGCALAALLLAQTLAHVQSRALTRLQHARGDREEAVRDLVRAMPAVKLHAWEPAARARVNVARGRELAALWRFQALGAARVALGFAGPALEAAATLALVYVSLAQPLTPAVAFATLALVRLVQTPLRVLPGAAVGMRAARQAQVKLSRFMDQEELDPYAVAGRDSMGLVAKYDPQDVVVAVEDATLGWGATGPLVFQHLDVTVGAGELLLVHGRRASGKSSFLGALLGEMQTREDNNGGGAAGRVYVGGSVAFSAQQPWLQQALSVRDNILFGLPYDRRKYHRVLDACGLVRPLARLPAGDRTLVQAWPAAALGTAKGRGLRSLVSLARACYSDADVYLLDEPLAHVRPASLARDVFSRCLLGLLRNKTRVLVTTRAEFVTSDFVDDAIRFEDGGRLVHSRDVVEDRKQSVSQDPREEGDDEEDDEDDEDQHTPDSSPVQADVATAVSRPKPLPKEETVDVDQLAMNNALALTRGSLSERPLRAFLAPEPAWDGQSWMEEKLGESVRTYLRIVGGLRVKLVLSSLLLLWLVLQVLSDLWLAFWTRPSAAETQYASWTADQLIYVALALSSGLLVLAYALGVAVAAVEGARHVFLALEGALLHAPLAFFDVFGSGNGRARAKEQTLSRRRELERVLTGEELSTLDSRLPIAGSAALALAATTSTALLVAVAVTRYYALLLAPVLYMYVRTARLYLRPARDLHYLERTARLAAHMHAAETLAGARVVRAFGLAHVHRVLGHQFWLLDVAARDTHLALHAEQWLALRVQLVGAAVVGVVALAALVALRHTLSAGLLALALYEAMAVDGGALESLVRVWAWLTPALPAAGRAQVAVNGAEVVTASSASSLPTVRRASEPLTPAQAEAAAAKPSLSWPAKGDVRFDGVSLRDPAVVGDETVDGDIGGEDVGAPPLALRGVSFRVQAGEKLAVVESSATSSIGRALLRVHELAAGRIVVDGVDVATLGLRTLRSRVACVSSAAPSSSLYDGSVRSQLDPSGADVEDERLWASLRAVGLAARVASLDDQLPGAVGLLRDPRRRLLLSLARALLTEPSLVVVALAPVLVLPPDDDRPAPHEPFVLDAPTTATLQRVLREELQDATVLLLLPPATGSRQPDQAQRTLLLNASDRVLVLAGGEVVLLETPAALTRESSEDASEAVSEALSREASEGAPTVGGGQEEVGEDAAVAATPTEIEASDVHADPKPKDVEQQKEDEDKMDEEQHVAAVPIAEQVVEREQ